MKKYIDYLKDNPEHYWFKRKVWGWGWVPAMWEGWVVILAFLAVIAGLTMQLAAIDQPTSSQISWFVAEVIASVVVLSVICYKKGEKPMWQWGFPKK